MCIRDSYYNVDLDGNAYLKGATYGFAGGGSLIAYDPTPNDGSVPEPGTLLLVIGGLIAAVWRRHSVTQLSHGVFISR